MYEVWSCKKIAEVERETLYFIFARSGLKTLITGTSWIRPWKSETYTHGGTGSWIWTPGSIRLSTLSLSLNHPSASCYLGKNFRSVFTLTLVGFSIHRIISFMNKSTSFCITVVFYNSVWWLSLIKSSFLKYNFLGMVKIQLVNTYKTHESF